jgi:hypothetical protein
MRKLTKLQWLVVLIAIYLALCVMGVFYIMTIDSSFSATEFHSTGKFLFLIFIVAPIGLVAVGILEAVLEQGLRATLRAASRVLQNIRK